MSTQAVGPPRWLEDERAWLITRYADAALLLKNETVTIVEVSRELRKLSGRIGGGAFSNLILLLGTSYPFQNSADHAAARSALREWMSRVSTRWTAAAVAGLVQGIVSPLVTGGKFDAVRTLAVRLPATIMADALELNVEQVQRCGALSREISAIWHREVTPLRALRAMEDGAGEIVDILRAARGEDRREDFARLAFLTMAGVDTTAGLLGSAIDMLASQPALQVRLRAEPARIPGFINETLRFWPPLRRLVGRRTGEAVQLTGGAIPRGALLVIDLGRAQRDPSAYAEPESFVLDRTGPPTLAFGFGAHACVGTALARLEARVLIEHLLANADIRCAGDAVRGDSPDWQEFRSLPICLERRPSA